MYVVLNGTVNYYSLNIMNVKEIDLIVSTLNLIIESNGYNVEELGFGYDPKTLEISCLDCTLEEGLEWTFDQLKTLTKHLNTLNNDFI